jgi:recombination protein RecA
MGGLPPYSYKGQYKNMTEKKGIRVLQKELNAMLGDGVVLRLGSEVEEAFTERIPTGSLGLDCVTGGGLPRGGLSQYIGIEGAGKTYMSLKAISQAQKKYGSEARIAYAAIEHEIDKRWAEKVGVVFDDTLLVLRASSGEEYLRALKEIIDSNDYQLVIIDSIPALTTVAQLEGELGDRHVALGASLITAFISTCIYQAKKESDVTINKTCVLAINQYRAKIGGFSPMGIPKQQYGGWSLKYAKLVDVDFSSSTHITKGTGEAKIDYGKTIKYRVAKGKAGCAEGGIGSFDLYYRDYPDENIPMGSIDWVKEYRITGIREGVITRAGRYFDVFDDRYTKDSLREKMEQDTEFINKLRTEILKSAGVIYE